MPQAFTHALDASAAIAFLKGEVGADVIAGLLVAENNRVCMHAVNVCEVYYDYLRSDGVDAAEAALEKLRALVAIVEDLSEGFLKRVARWKVVEPRCTGLADAFLAATAAEHGCALVTCDHNDFGEIAKSSEVEVIFFR